MNLPDGFDRRVFEIFSSEEVSEPLIMVYQYLSLVARLEGDAFTFSRNELCYLSNGKEVWKSPLSYDSYYDHIKNSFVEVFERDNLVQKLFRYEIRSDDSLAVEIIESMNKIKS